MRYSDSHRFREGHVQITRLHTISRFNVYAAGLNLDAPTLIRTGRSTGTINRDDLDSPEHPCPP